VVAASASAETAAVTDRLSISLFSLAAFLAVLALLAGQIRAASEPSKPHPVVVMRKIYRTTVIETIKSGSGPTGTSVSQSVSSSGGGAPAMAAPTTRTSGGG
jgi:hypothetical protein